MKLKRIKAVKVALSHLRSETATRGVAAAAVALNLYICVPHKKFPCFLQMAAFEPVKSSASLI